jgi:hypothetical protein
VTSREVERLGLGWDCRVEGWTGLVSDDPVDSGTNLIGWVKLMWHLCMSSRPLRHLGSIDQMVEYGWKTNKLKGHLELYGFVCVCEVRAIG